MSSISGAGSRGLEKKRCVRKRNNDRGILGSTLVHPAAHACLWLSDMENLRHHRQRPGVMQNPCKCWIATNLWLTIKYNRYNMVDSRERMVDGFMYRDIHWIYITKCSADWHINIRLITYAVLFRYSWKCSRGNKKKHAALSSIGSSVCLNVYGLWDT